MAKAKLFEEIDQKMREILARSPAADLEKNLRALLASAFSRLNLVTREEFDVQREVLARTRAKLQELEAKLAELEKTGDREIGRSKTAPFRPHALTLSRPHGICRPHGELPSSRVVRFAVSTVKPPGTSCGMGSCRLPSYTAVPWRGWTRRR